MVESIQVALVQLNSVVGDLVGNRAKIVDAYKVASETGSQLAVFPQLALCGAPPQDLLLRRDFLSACKEQLDGLAGELVGECVAVVGVPYSIDPDGEQIVLDASAVIRNGAIETVVAREHLGAQGILDDSRYFVPASEAVTELVGGSGAVIEVGGARIAIVVGDDLTLPLDGRSTGTGDRGDADLVVNPGVSRFYRGVQSDRFESIGRASVEWSTPVLFVNAVGGQDELIFDGGSMVAAGGSAIHVSERFVESVDIVSVPIGANDGSDEIDSVTASGSDVESPESELWDALVLGIRDYVKKNGFGAVGLGLSGGVDSALVAALAFDAIGADRVHAVLMPSRYSSESSVVDATELATNLGIGARTIPIEPAHSAFESMLAESFMGHAPDLTEENLQARVRGTTLMALSNKFGWLILVTGNKSEATVGYSTLYGDTAGGFAPIQDIDKQTVYELCAWYNRRCDERGDTARIPESILTKAPSAELRPGQRDDQSLPPYPELDPIIDSYVEGGASREELISGGADSGVVDRIVGLIRRSEYKRRQCPPGLIVTKRSPGFRRTLPITTKPTGWDH